MTSRSPARPLASLLRSHHAALRRALIARHALRALAACALLLLAAVAAGLPGGGSRAAAARLALLAGGATAALAFAVRRLLAETPRFDSWLEAVEHRLPELRSWLRNALELEAVTPEHTSGELAEAVQAEATRRLAAAPLAEQRPGVRPRAPLLATAGAAAALTALAFVAPRPTWRAWNTLWDPASAAPPVTLAVEPGSVTISPGATLAVRASVRGTPAAPRLTGDGPSPAAQLESDARGLRRWRFDLPPITRARDYAVRVERAASPRYRISLAGEPQPVSFTFEVRAPGYARLPAQQGSATSGDLSALAGSTARFEVTFDRDLESLAAAMPGGRTAEWSAITPRRWRGDVPVTRDGEWSLLARAASGEGRYRYRVTALPDAPPVVTVVLPQGDADVPAGSLVPCDVLAQDDLGLTSMSLQFRKDASAAWRDVPLQTFRDEPREARVETRWDASALALLPGETGTFRFEVADNNRIQGPSRAYSPEFRLRFPSLAELYDKIDQGQEHVQASLEHVAEQARELQKSLDQLQRTQPHIGVQSSPQFERSEEMRRALERQQQLAQQIDKAVQDVHEQAAQAAERQAFRDELQSKLREMGELMRQIQSPEFKDALQRMQKALEQMDRRNMEQALPQLREQNKDLLQNLERSLALMRQLRDEEKLDALSKRAEELKAQQDALNRRHEAEAQKRSDPHGDPSAQAKRDALAGEQREAAKRTDALAKDAKEAAQQVANPDAQHDLQNAAQQLEQQASPSQSQAASQSQQGQPEQAEQSGEKASQSLQQAAEQMSRSSASAQAARDQRQAAAVKRASQDLVSLGQQASQPSQGASAQQQADEQTDLSEGVARVSDSLAALSRETPFLTPDIQRSLGEAMSGLSKAGRQTAQGNRAGGEQLSAGAQAALNSAVLSLRDAANSMCNKPGHNPNGNGGAGPGEKMSALGQRQGQLNQRSRELAERLSQQMRLSAGDRDELRRLADEQARIRGELEQIQRDDETRHQLLGRLDQADKEMQQVEERLREGPPGDDVQQQQVHILSRLLDAQRSINRRDYDPQREARQGVDVARSSPAELPASMLRENDRLRFDLLKAEADRYPAQYRAFIERYLQKLNGSAR